MQEYSSDHQLLGLTFEVKEVCICSRHVRGPTAVTVSLAEASNLSSRQQPQRPHTAALCLQSS
jgi:hypothetical protein